MGSNFALSKISAIKETDVVFPWLHATVIVHFILINSLSISGRLITGILSSIAFLISGLFFEIAEE